MKERDFERLIRSIDVKTLPPEGLKEDILARARVRESRNEMPDMSKMERFLFQKPLLASGILSLAISGVLLAVMGHGYTNILFGIFGVR